MINRGYTKELKEIRDQDWILKIYKENLDGLIAYFIQFVDGSYIAGNIKDSRFDYSIVKKNSYICDESQAELFVNFVDVTFEGKLARASFLKALHNEYDAKRERKIDGMTKEAIQAEMLLAAKEENFQKAAKLKKKLDEL